MQLPLTTMPLRIPFCESRGRLVVMELPPFGPRCDCFPGIEHIKVKYSMIKYAVDTVAFGSLQSCCSVDETSSSILDALVDLL